MHSERHGLAYLLKSHKMCFACFFACDSGGGFSEAYLLSVLVRLSLLAQRSLRLFRSFRTSFIRLH